MSALYQTYNAEKSFPVRKVNLELKKGTRVIKSFNSPDSGF